MGGKGPEVLSTFTSDFGSILAGLHRTKIHGTAHLSSSIQVAGVCHLSSISSFVEDTDEVDDLACSKAPFRKVSETTHHRFFLLPYRRRRKDTGQAG
jgi:hypothetical protein